MLGLGLVVLLIGLLLSGTLRGLWSYYLTMNSIRSKLAEFKTAEELEDAVARLVAPHTLALLDRHPALVKRETAEARTILEQYRNELDLDAQQDPDAISHERELVGVLLTNLDAFEAAVVEEARRPRILIPGAEHDPGESASLDPKLKEQERRREHQVITAASLAGELALPGLPLQAANLLIGRDNLEDPVRRQVRALTVNASDLRNTIYDKLENHLGESRRNYQVTLWIVVPATVIGLLLMAGMMRYFYAWVFHPIRDLESGVNRVARGEFEHRIQLHSGDEMEDLAAAFNDMTHQLKELYTDLAGQVNERSRQLVRSERLASVGFLAAGVAHEINNPLHSIALCSEALESRLLELLGAFRMNAGTNEDIEIISKYLKMIQDEAFRCKRITEKLLEFSRTGERRREAADLGQIVQSVIDIAQLHPTSRNKQIVFERGDRHGDRFLARINVEEIKSVMLNLIVNSLESMEEGGLVSIRMSRREGMAEVQLSDTGCGMTQEVLENIFEPFFTRSRTGKGTGLGLTISHRIVNQHGGEIVASSSGPNQGSTFTVRLPLSFDESQAEGPRLAA
jgi:signal transduction histidine kinase